MSASYDGTLRLWAVMKGRRLVTLLVFHPYPPEKPSPDWIAFTPESYYEGSRGVHNLIGWEFDLGGGGSQFFGGEQFAHTFHRADLVRKALHGEALPAPPALESPVHVR